MSYGYEERRFFVPKRTDDLVARALPFVHTWVTVRGWHENLAMREAYPDDELVGFVSDFAGDIPESELLTVPLERADAQRLKEPLENT